MFNESHIGNCASQLFFISCSIPMSFLQGVIRDSFGPFMCSQHSIASPFLQPLSQLVTAMLSESPIAFAVVPIAVQAESNATTFFLVSAEGPCEQEASMNNPAQRDKRKSFVFIFSRLRLMW